MKHFPCLLVKVTEDCGLHHAYSATSCSGFCIFAFPTMTPAPPFDIFFMGSFPTPELTWEELITFHETDRALYSLLTMRLLREPFGSMSVMALWFWLEQSGFKTIIKDIASKPHFVINQLADEAIAYINPLLERNQFNPPIGPIDLPLTQKILNNNMFLFQNQSTALLGIGKVLNEVCFRILSDLLEQAKEMNAARAFAENQMVMTSILKSPFSYLNVNGIGRIDSGFLQPPGFIQPPEYVDRDKRTMFVTFSKGYPVPERDIREFFYFRFGDCIEFLHMDEVRCNQQSLFARIVFYSPGIIEDVLKGAEKVKFSIKGKHIWMRRFVPKDKVAESSQGMFGSLSGSGSGFGSGSGSSY